MAPARTPAHSSSVDGAFSNVPSAVITVPTDSHSVSAAGSITFNIRSFIPTVVWNGGIAGAGADDEHDVHSGKRSGASHVNRRIGRHLNKVPGFLAFLRFLRFDNYRNYRNLRNPRNPRNQLERQLSGGRARSG